MGTRRSRVKYLFKLNGLFHLGFWVSCSERLLFFYFSLAVFAAGRKWRWFVGEVVLEREVRWCFFSARVGPIGRVSVGCAVDSISGWRLNVRSDLSTQFTHNENIKLDFAVADISLFVCYSFSRFEFVFAQDFVLLSIVQNFNHQFAFGIIIIFFCHFTFTALFGSHCILCVRFRFYQETSGIKTVFYVFLYQFLKHKTSKLCQRLASMFSFTLRLGFSFLLFVSVVGGISPFPFLYRTNTPNFEFK